MLRLVPKLRLGTPVRGSSASRDVARCGPSRRAGMRSGASRRLVPKRSLGTRENYSLLPGNGGKGGNVNGGTCAGSVCGAEGNEGSSGKSGSAVEPVKIKVGGNSLVGA